MLIITLTIMMSLSLIVSILSFLQKGPLFSTIYIISKKEDREELKTKDEYYFVAIIFLGIAISFGTRLIDLIFEFPFMRKVSVVIIIFICIYAIIGSITTESKRIKKNRE
ncbi:hypothetical protein GOQ27_13970 [Clostridium sp. D2Q-11]|uniref:DUF3784 domain-containing protein n=1 Tax=Anaeromonas frigoriresistens TaxID=2683708 RepID=A0A942V1R4_9FIRM|nr:hypothetical protein [Anaeromonas frigoriresistens]MBS4539577.1 hypothetical protein [Anaeromonas frigoriresistens]